MFFLFENETQMIRITRIFTDHFCLHASVGVSRKPIPTRIGYRITNKIFYFLSIFLNHGGTGITEMHEE